MKRVLIAGAGSYIGEHLNKWLSRTPADFDVQTLDTHSPNWELFNFSGYDAVVMVAGLAHKKETIANAPLYDAVNHLMAVEVAQQAKHDGVTQFVFFSSMSVYGLTVGRIHADTPVKPTTAYGRSKLAAETDMQILADDHFHVAILRPPMIYGPGCKGNYPRLSALLRRLPFFPYVQNERSMLYIDTLCGWLQRLLQSGEGGLFFPQNAEYVSTTELAKQIALAHGKQLHQPRGLGFLLGLLARQGGTIGKLFGTLTYDQAMSQAFRGEPEPDFAQTIRDTEGAGT